MANKDAVEAYHGKLTDIKLRVPSKDTCGIDYVQLFKDRASELGYINTKGKDKGLGNINAYILSLISKDLGIDITSSVK